MIRLNGSIRLTADEIERLERRTGYAPVGIRTIADLEAYIERCKSRYPGHPDAQARLFRLFDEEAMRCISS